MRNMENIKPYIHQDYSSDAKRVQFIVSYPLSSEPVIKNRIEPFIKIAIKNNYQVEIVSPDHECFTIGDIKIRHILCPDKFEKPRNFFWRAVFEYKQTKKLLRESKRYESSIKIISIPSMFLLFNSYLLEKGKIIFDIRDLTWSYIEGKNFLYKILGKIFDKMAKKLLKKAYVISVTNPAEKEYLERKLKVNKKVLLVSNGVSKEKFKRLSDLNSPKKHPIVAYIGNIGIAQNLITLINAAEATPNINYVIVGDGTSFSEIKKVITEKNLYNVKLLGRVPWNQVLDTYQRANILYAQLSPEFSTAMPSKLYEYLSTGKFILYGGTGEAISILKRFDHYMTIPPCNTQKLIESLEKIIITNKFIETSQRNISLIGREYIREKSAQFLFDYLEKKK